MLDTVAVENYRSLRRLVVPLGGCNVVTGPNGSGKSSLYRSLRLLADSALGGSDTGDLSAEPFSPSAPISPPPTSTTSSAITQEKRPVSSPPMRSRNGRPGSGARCMPPA